MVFISTRNNKISSDFKNAIFQGLSPDGGLFVPENFEDFSSIINGFSTDSSFLDISIAMTARILADEISMEDARDICTRAFSFSPSLTQVTEKVSLLELFHGPSFAFKDFGASFLSSAMEFFLKKCEKRAIILTATSGDTGSAVARAFYGKKNIDVVILYPSGRVSPLQEKQLTTLYGNVHALEVKGSFDDCQRIVKEAFMDPVLKEKYGLTSANSINLGRLLPQSYYYIWAHSRMNKQPYSFCVPSGNFGNLTAGLFAWKWGMKPSRFIAATNINDVVPEYLVTGTYKPRSSRQTYSNAMDVGAPSNFERMLYLFNNDNERMKQSISGTCVTDTETLATIKDVYTRYGLILDPHTAVGINAVQKLNIETPVLVLSTAHPGKFAEIVQKAIGKDPEIPEALRCLLDKEKKTTIINNSIHDLRNFLNTCFTF